MGSIVRWPKSRPGGRGRWSIDLGKAGGENRAITDLGLDVPVVTMGAPVLIRANLRNFGGARADGVRARVTADGILGLEEPFDLPPGEDVPAVFRQQFSTPGDHLIEVFIDDDPLALDNRRWLIVPVREALDVLLVDGHFKSEPYQAETDYLAQAASRPVKNHPDSRGRSRSRSSPSRSFRARPQWRSTTRGRSPVT